MVSSNQRRYDIDWLRIIALGLLILYHTFISFTDFAKEIAFPQNEEELELIYIIMSFLNIWRMPLIFIISGMGIFFAMKKRNWIEIFNDRAIRIGIPYLFGLFILGPLTINISTAFFYKEELWYFPIHAHLWFLMNIWIYLCFDIVFFVYLQKKPQNKISILFNKILRFPYGIFLFSIIFIFEGLLFNNAKFTSYADSPHGLIMGNICFVLGYIFVSNKDIFWKSVEKVWQVSLSTALILCFYRISNLGLDYHNAIIGLESFFWMISFFGIGSKYLNQNSKILNYLTSSVYPIYILHMPIQFTISLFILPLNINSWIKLLVIAFLTYLICKVLYEFIKKVKFLRPLFGMKYIS